MAAAADAGQASGLLTDGGKPMDTTGCPEPGCGLPAEILDRAVLESTDGPIEHARIACVGGHGFLMPVEMLPQREDLRATITGIKSIKVE